MSRESRLSFLLVLFAPSSPSDRASVADGASSTTFSLFVIVFGVIPVYLPVCLRCLLYVLLSSVCLGSTYVGSGQSLTYLPDLPPAPSVPPSPDPRVSNSLTASGRCCLSLLLLSLGLPFSCPSLPLHTARIPNPLLHILPPFPSPSFFLLPTNNHSP